MSTRDWSSQGINDVPLDAFMYTPADGTITDPDYGGTVICRAIETQTTGNLAVVTQAGRTVILPMTAGIRKSIALRQIRSTDTTVTGAVAVYL